jgi:hypothetical protein
VTDKVERWKPTAQLGERRREVKILRTFNCANNVCVKIFAPATEVETLRTRMTTITAFGASLVAMAVFSLIYAAMNALDAECGVCCSLELNDKPRFAAFCLHVDGRLLLLCRARWLGCGFLRCRRHGQHRKTGDKQGL